MEKYILSHMKDNNFAKAAYEIYQLTDYNKRQYPEYYKWYYQKNIPRIIAGSGEAIFYLDGFQIVGLSLLKKDNNESKICTLLINEEYRNKGYSKIILEEAFKYLTEIENYETIFNDNMISEFINNIKFLPIKFNSIAAFHDRLNIVTVISTMKKYLN